MVNTNAVITEWVEQYTKSMYSWAFYRTSNHSIAEDLVQETFIAVLQTMENFDNRSSVKTWLFSILNNKIFDYHRTAYKRGELQVHTSFEEMFDENENWKPEFRPQPNTVDHEHLLDNHEFTLVLHRCLDHLPSQWNAVLHLKFLSEQKADLICQELEISTTNLWQIVHRAKMQVRKCLEQHWFNTDRT